ncbi:hypothetical protein [Streptococcus salivarius]|uniref:hypothetical protein n=1 Tax=Streptococcus salivarius TaxID=1304 RepID=UPI00321BAEC7
MFINYAEAIVLSSLLFVLLLFFFRMPIEIISFLWFLYLLTAFVIALIVIVKRIINEVK